ncbi:lipopolysaccharide biosynthesis protein [Microbacterium sp. RD1]|uniref:lipopolysaccharide biosynthesis protein n=1 Tax=Microbacterium sp. RD1 TaxID=3457313 RepID=UPI003FA543FB
MRRFFTHPIVLSSGLRVVALIMGVLGSVVIARVGGAELKGISSTYAAANAIVFVFLNLDVAQQALRQSRERRDPALVWTVLGRVWGAYLALGAAAIVIVIFADAEPAWLILGGVAFTLGMQGGVAAVGLRGAHIGSIGAVFQQAALICAVLATSSLGVLDNSSIKVVIVVSYLTPLVIYLPAVLARSRRHDPNVPTREIAVWIWRGLPWQLGRLMQILLQKLDVVFLLLVAGAAAAGIYSVSLSTAMLCTIVPAQVSNHVLHKTANSHGDVRILRQLCVALMAGAVPAALLGVIGAPLITLLYGPGFAEAYEPMLFCLPGAVAYGVLQVQTNFVRIRGSWRTFTLTGALAVAIMLLCLFAFVPSLGASGAAIAFSAGTIVCVVLGLVFFRSIFRAL